MSMPFVYVWDAARHGKPKAYEQALEMLRELSERSEPAVSEKIMAFGEEFGRFIDGSGEASWLNVLGGTGSHARSCASAVLRLELPDTDWQPVLVEMVDMANKHGLVALHEEGVSLFLPNGKVLPAVRAKAWSGLKAALKNEGGFPQTLGQFKKWLTPQVEMMLARHGNFVKEGSGRDSDTSYLRVTNGSSLCVSVDYYGGDGYFCFNIIFDFMNSMVSDVCKKFNFIMPDIVFWGGALTAVLGYESKGDVEIRTAHDARKTLMMCEEAMFPALDDTSAIHKLDELLNGDADVRYRNHYHNFVFKPQCLIVARLAGNPRFEDLAKELAVDSGWYGNEDIWKEEWPKLVRYLREEVKPLI